MDTYRLFVAVALPEPVHKRLGGVQQRLRAKLPERSVRWVRTEGIHLTLKFLGDTPRDRIPAIGEALKVVSRNAPRCELTVQGVGCYPSPRRPRVVWVGVKEPTGRLKALWRAVEEAMMAIGYAAERHGFSPHLTLGRVRRGASRADLQQIGEAIAGTEEQGLGTVEVRGFELIRSVLRPTGAEYTTLASFPLRGGSAPR
ncbi:MAG: RNA 2',3'-cyclic phosphodiesterase [Anaerolineae bacterium]